MFIEKSCIVKTLVEQKLKLSFQIQPFYSSNIEEINIIYDNILYFGFLPANTIYNYLGVDFVTKYNSFCLFSKLYENTHFTGWKLISNTKIPLNTQLENLPELDISQNPSSSFFSPKNDSVRLVPILPSSKFANVALDNYLVHFQVDNNTYPYTINNNLIDLDFIRNFLNLQNKHYSSFMLNFVFPNGIIQDLYDLNEVNNKNTWLHLTDTIGMQPWTPKNNYIQFDNMISGKFKIDFFGDTSYTFTDVYQIDFKDLLLFINNNSYSEEFLSFQFDNEITNEIHLSLYQILFHSYRVQITDGIGELILID